MTRRRCGPALCVLAALSLFGVAACSGGSSKKLIPPPPTTGARLTTAPPASDYTGVALDPVPPGRVNVPPVEVLGGDATLTGVVLGPDGPVGGATIRLERFVGDAVGRLDIVANADGTWAAPQLNPPTTLPPVPTVPSFPDPAFPDQLTTTTTLAPTTTAAPPPTTRAGRAPGLFGGRYRVRAWRTPDLALTTPQILFVEGRRATQLPLQLLRYEGFAASAVSSPDPPVFGELLTLTAVVTSASVDPNGVVQAVPAPNRAVSLSPGPGLTLLSGPTVTNAQGRAAFQLQCVALGQSSADLVVDGAAAFSLPVRPCAAPATTSSTGPFSDPTGSTFPVPGGAATTSSSAPPPT